MSLQIKKLLEDWAATFLAMFIGPAATAVPPGQKPVRSPLHVAQMDEAGRFAGTGPASDDKLVSWAARLVTVLLDGKAQVEKPLTKPLLDALIATRESELGLTPGGPETAQPRLKKAMNLASAIGLNAHVLSMLLSMDVMGFGDLNATGIAAMMSEAAGFSELMGQVNRPLWEGYLGVPWREYLCKELRPWRPDLDLLAKARREREEWIHVPSGDVPYDLKDRLAHKGLGDTDIDLWHRAVWTWPAMRQLATLLEDPAVWASESTTRDLFDHLGYTDDVRRFALDAIKLRQAGAWTTRWLNQQISNIEYGLIDYAEFEHLVENVALPDHVRSAVHRVGETADYTAWCKAVVERAKLAYSRDEINDQELYNELDSVGMNPQRAKLVVDSERLRRMHKVWILSDVELAREALTVYRQLFIYGLMSEASYRGALAAAALEPEMIEERYFVDNHKRILTVAREIREFELPTLRDNLLDGQMTLDAYRGRLVALEFPTELLPTEMAYVKTLLDRQRRQRVERYQLPAAERAYVLSLIPQETLRRLYEEADRSGDEIAIRLKLLDYLRANQHRAGAGGRRSTAEIVADAEWKYIDGEISEGELVQVYKDCGVPPDRVARRLAVLRPLRL